MRFANDIDRAGIAAGQHTMPMSAYAPSRARPLCQLDVTVVVPTKNEQHNIVPFLAAIPPDVPVIMVDDSADETPTLAARTRPDNLTVIRTPGNIATARQLGADHANSDWLLFTDADVRFAPDYFGRLHANYTRFGQRYGVIYGAKQSTGRFRRYYRFFTAGQKLIAACGIPAASGSNLLITKTALTTAGGFDVNLSVNEDSEIAWRIKRHGYPVVFAPDLIVHESDHRRLERGVVRKTVHSLLRCALLYFDLLSDEQRASDWGYWQRSPARPAKPPR